MKYAAAVLVGRGVRTLARLRKRGGGSAVPGLVVNRIAPRFLADTLRSFPEGLVVVSGSSGKSTTTKMLVAVLDAHGRRVFTNPSTANIAQGLTSALLERTSLAGRIDADVAVLEMDEAHGARIAPDLRPKLSVLTNVMTDQIDRFHDSEQVARHLRTIATSTTDAVVLNADDGFVAALAGDVASGVRVTRFGVTDTVLAGLPRGLGTTRTSDARTTDGLIITAVGDRTATVSWAGESANVGLPARGVHYAVDAAAALAGAGTLLGDAFSLPTAVAAISAMPPVFGRGEVLTVRGREVEFVLVQNPTSFQLNVDHLPEELDQVLVAMGSDVRDPGYFWPVDARRLRRVHTVTGSKAPEMALQLEYQGVPVQNVSTDLPRAVDEFLSLPEPVAGRKTIVFTADPMRRIRAHLGLHS